MTEPDPVAGVYASLGVVTADRPTRRGWLAQLDALLWELESANLRHADRCPNPCWDALRTLQGAILPAVQIPAESGLTSEALDIVFALQEVVQHVPPSGPGGG